MLAELARNKCLVYLDDVLVIGRSLEEHNQNLREVLERFTKPKSAILLRQKSSLLATLCLPLEIARTQRKWKRFPTPTNIRPFLGLAS